MSLDTDKLVTVKSERKIIQKIVKVSTKLRNKKSSFLQLLELETTLDRKYLTPLESATLQESLLEWLLETTSLLQRPLLKK